VAGIDTGPARHERQRPGGAVALLAVEPLLERDERRVEQRHRGAGTDQEPPGREDVPRLARERERAEAEADERGAGRDDRAQAVPVGVPADRDGDEAADEHRAPERAREDAAGELGPRGLRRDQDREAVQHGPERERDADRERPHEPARRPARHRFGWSRARR
jgi:hypothetical protein